MTHSRKRAVPFVRVQSDVMAIDVGPSLTCPHPKPRFREFVLYGTMMVLGSNDGHRHTRRAKPKGEKVPRSRQQSSRIC